MGSGAGMNEIAALFRRGAELERQGVPYALVTVIRALAPTSAKAGDKALVCADGTIFGWIGGGCAQPAVIRTVRQALADGRPRQIRVTPERSGSEVLDDIVEFTMHCHSGGTLELFVDPVVHKPELVVFGQSPVAQALAGLGSRVGFHVVWIGPEGSEAEAGPGPTETEVQRLARAELRRVAPGAFVVVATQGRGDLAALKDALGLGATHIAFVASRRKGDLLKESLRDAGADPAAVDAIEAPAGQAIGAQTPEEIALSVLAALVARRRGRPQGAESAADDGAHEAAAEAPGLPPAREVRRTPSASATAPPKPSCCDG